MTGAIIIGVIILVVVIFFANQKHKELVSSGEIISRDTSFVNKAEIFTLTGGDWETVWNALKTADYHGAARGTKDGQKALVSYQGSSWTAELYKKKTEPGEKECYYFSFTHWSSRNGVPNDVLNMNRLLTTIEKVFLSIDPNTQVKTELLETKTRHKLF